MNAGISNKDLSRIRELVAAGHPLDAATAQVLLNAVDTLIVGEADVTQSVPVLILEGEDNRDTDAIPDEAMHPVVRATAGVFHRAAGAPSSLSDLRRNAWEERVEQILRQN